jgi:hypothetical protein
MTADSLLSFIKEISLRDAEQIAKDIAALEAEVETDLACSRKSYAANCIRMDIARLKQDVQMLASAMAIFADIFDKIGVLTDDTVNLRARLEGLERLNLLQKAVQPIAPTPVFS